MIGQPTRGKTAPNRLRRVDAFLLHHETLQDGDLLVDLGFGGRPWTTLETARAFRDAEVRLRVIGVELDPERVAFAARYADRFTTFVRGGFDLPVDEPVAVIRAMNVLRQYDEAATAEAKALMAGHLRDGGLLVEGTCGPHGRVLVVQLLRRRGDDVVNEGLLFSTNFKTEEPFHPRLFQARLPKDFIHHVAPGEPLHGFFEQWTRAWDHSAGFGTFGPRERWVHTCRTLADQGLPIRRSRWLARRGYLWLTRIPS